VTADLACRDLVELVTAHLEGALPGPDAAAVQAHLAQCPACRRYLDQVRTTITVLGRVDVQGLPADVRARLLDAFARRHGRGAG
jgi:anti-sigma factor RsiW